ncbi:MAG TPA: hypothetical protein VMK32_14180 [Burkholderiaceae bacterium]|nr:hypothetical protein [Burkholderiaceae bacterium]
MNAPITAAERRRFANALRFLAIGAVEAAKSGHPGMPIGMADIAEVLWRDRDGQPPVYRASVSPSRVPRVAPEAGHGGFWRRRVGLDGGAVDIASFGGSARAATLREHFGPAASAVADALAAAVADMAAATTRPLAA